jgi:hypothetical protein
MTIEAGLDPDLPIPLSCNIHPSTGNLEVKFRTSSLTHPETLLHVDIDDLDAATFKAEDFGSYTVEATTVDGDDWTASGSAVISEELFGEGDPGQEHEIKVTASNGGTPKTATIRVRIREQGINPLP